MNESILNWYEFKEGSKILLAGDAEGGVREFLNRRKCKVTYYSLEDAEKYISLDSVNIISKTSEIDVPEDEYDYIILLGVLESAESPEILLKKFSGCLKFGGRLLVTVRNRYGLKYFCGAPDPHTGVVFDGINNYLFTDKIAPKCYSRSELEELFESIDDRINFKFYYPLPDEKFPQIIMTDEYSDKKDVAERFVDYTYAESHFGVSHRIIQDIIRNGSLSFIANTFLIEITFGCNCSDIIYALTTTDRGPEYGMSTTIHSNGIVKKRNLWKAGEKQLEQLYTNMEYLKNKGIPVIDIRSYKDESGLYLTMPYITDESLDERLKVLIKTDIQSYLSLFDKIYDYIIKSYNNVEESIFIDLAPCNAFFIREKNDILFYDQEFKYLSSFPKDEQTDKKTLLVKYSMYRTISYFYASAREASIYYSQDKMYDRYGISETDIIFLEKIEKEFINSVRKLDANKELIKKATPDYEKIYKNMTAVTRLMSEPEKPYKKGYVPGVFDLLHVGHLRLFEKCKARCEHLIVGVLTDELVYYYKKRYPVIPYEERAELIKGLEVVDEVIPVDFSNTDKLAAWEQLHYDCHFSGDDHVGHWDDIKEELIKRGSNMEFFPYTKGVSTTMIREKKDTK